MDSTQFGCRIGRELAIAGLIVLALCARLAWADSPAERESRLAAHYALEKPDGNGPFPAVMLVPGCSGFHNASWKAHFDRVAQRVREAGFAVLRVNYLAAGQVSTCEVIMNPEEVTADVASAAKYLRAQPFIKPDAINVIGWSYGAGAAFNALDGGDGREPAQVAAVVAYYPVVGWIRPWEKVVPILVLCGDLDVTAHCERLDPLLPLLPGGKQVKVVTYAQTAHGFDNSDLPAKTTTMNGNPAGYNAAVAPSAWSEAEKFLRR